MRDVSTSSHMATYAAAPSERARHVAAPIRITLLGGWSLTGAQYDDLSLSGRRLLTLIALRGPTNRHRLAATMWPDATEERAQGSLRTALWRLRHLHRDLIKSADNDVRLGENVQVDFHELLCLIWKVLEGSILGFATVPFELSHGELAPDLFDDWLLIERERLRQLRLHALETLAARFAAAGHFSLGMEAASAAICVEPLRESARRTMASICLRSGDPSAAWRQFREYRNLLSANLGITPSRRFENLFVGRSGTGPASCHRS